MSIIKSYIYSRIREVGISQTQLVAQLGYRNINKGLQRLGCYFSDPTDNPGIQDRLLSILGEDEGKFRLAIDQQAKALNKRREEMDRLAFRPHLRCNPAKKFKPQGLMARWGFHAARVIKLPMELANLSKDDEHRMIVAACRAHQEEYQEMWAEGGTFDYYRIYGEVIQLDQNLQVIGPTEKVTPMITQW